MNTALHYQYRDGDNYKKHGTWIITGPCSPDQEKALRDACMHEDENDFFVPETVGIPMLDFDGWDEQSDHAFCTVEALEPTEAEAQDSRDIETLTADFAERDWEADGEAFAAERAD